MKICRVAPSYPTDHNPGAGEVGYNITKYIPEPTLYITRKRGGNKYPVPPHVIVREISVRDGPTPDLVRRQVFGPHGGGLRTHWQLLRHLRGLKFFVRAIPSLLRWRPDIVVCASLRTMYHGLFAQRVLRSRFILSLHNSSEIVLIKRLPLLRFLARQADAILVMSPAMARELADVVPPGKIRISSTGVDLSFFVPGEGPRRKQLLAIGAFKWKKGYSCLLNAMPAVLQRHPGYVLKIVGDGEERQQVVEQIDRLALTERVHLCGVVSRGAVAQLLRESKLFVLASLAEGLPKALLEALACGTPAVVTTGCNADEIIGNTGLMVEAGDVQGLAQAINRLIEDEELWRQCARNCRLVAEAYDWPKVAARVYGYYCDLLRASP